jgi:hypothetical protein
VRACVHPMRTPANRTAVKIVSDNFAFIILSYEAV